MCTRVCPEPTEYCELEQFRPRCPADKVIIVTEARYGLVSLGRCLQADFGYVGCFADVLDYIGAKCSGRRACQQQVPDRFMKEAAARCRPEFNGFLYAAYKCIDGTYTILVPVVAGLNFACIGFMLCVYFACLYCRLCVWQSFN